MSAKERKAALPAFSGRNFTVGMAGVAVICGGLGLWATMNGTAALSRHLEGMPAASAEIQWNNVLAPRKPIKPPNHIAIDIPAPPSPEEKVADDKNPDEKSGAHEIETALKTILPEHAEEIAEKARGQTPEKADPVLSATPLDGLYETTQWGRLPLIRKSDGLTPFQAYRRPFDRSSSGGKPIISVVVYDLGLSDSAMETALRDMPADVTFVLSPYMKTPDIWIGEARSRGHELWLSLPMEGKDYPLVDPGPHTPLIGAPEKENIERLYWIMGRATNYTGFVAPPDSAFLKSEADMRPLLGRIYGRGLGFIDGSLLPSLTPQTMARGAKAPYGTIDVWADNPVDRASIADALAQAEKLAAQQGFAAIAIRPYPLSFQMLKEWFATLSAKGMVLAPLSTQTGQ